MAVRRLCIILVLLLALSGGLTAARVGLAPAGAATDGSVVLDWNKQVLAAIVAAETDPTVAARALAVVHTAIYDAWAAYDPVAVDTRGRLRADPALRRPAAERTVDNKRKAVSFAAYAALVDLFPSKPVDFAGFMTGLGYDPAAASPDSIPDPATPEGVGTLAARAVLAYRHHDGANQLGDEPDRTTTNLAKAYADYTGYRPVNAWDQVNNPDKWQPLCLPLPPPGATGCAGEVQSFVTPFWANVTPFALTKASQFRPPGPYTYLGSDGKPSGKYVDQVDKLTQYSKQLDDFRKTLADYWQDGRGTVTPAGHWNLFAQWVAGRDANTIDKDARLFFALNGALLDASVSAWDAKRAWNSIRPISAVRWLRKGQVIQAWGGPYKGPAYIKGEDWLPYQPAEDLTPASAEYASGHATFSAAAAEVLTAFTGRGNFELKVPIEAGSSKVEPKTDTNPGVPAKPITLSWTNFRYAAGQAGLSREYAGVSFERGDKDARAAGASVGKNAWAKALTYFNGTATP
jgi:hypothetical protein